MARKSGGILAGIAALLLAVSPGAAGQAPAPQRIVSMNQCTDILLLMLADPGQIASISFVTHQPQWTPPEFVETVRNIPANRALAEEVIVLKPDLVVTGRYTGAQAVQLLRRVNVPVVEFDPESSIADISANLRKMGEAVGASARAEQVIADMEAGFAALRAEHSEPRGVVADIGVNGWMSGEGTLTADVLSTAGYVTLGQALGVTGYANLTLEQTVASKPAALAPLNAWTEPPSLATSLFRHPALRRLAGSLPVAVIPERLVACGSPEVLKAARTLAEAKAPSTAGRR